jgi:hypothetical protein
MMTWPRSTVLALHAAQQQARVVAGHALVQDLVEHLDAGHRGLGGLLLDPDDLDLVAGVDDTALDPAGDDRAAAGDREHVLDRHQERLVHLTGGLGDVLVARRHELGDLVAPLRRRPREP